ncbi:MAG: NUDIX hydrolase [Armatimonadota bacterium]|nr:NUDIX hydrolase [Armatimonadota bacterium]
MDLREKTIESKRIYDGRVVNLRVDTVELPNGRRAAREVVEHKGAVAIVPLIDTDVVVMVRQFRQPTGEILLEIPAGTLDPGEDPDDCAAREIIEETGYRAGTLHKMFKSYLAPGYSSEMLHTYLATDLRQTEAAPEADELLDVVTVGLNEALGMIETGQIKDAKTICGLLMAYRRLHATR